MKKTAWCGQGYGQLLTNSSSLNSSKMSNSGNPPDRGPGGASVKNLSKLEATTLSSAVPSSSMHLYSAANSGMTSTSGQVASRMQNAVHSVLSTSPLRQTSVAHSTASTSKLATSGSSNSTEQFTNSAGGSREKSSGEPASCSSAEGCASSFSLASKPNVLVNSTVPKASSAAADDLPSRHNNSGVEQNFTIGLRQSSAQVFKSPDTSDLMCRRWEERGSATLASFTVDWTLNQIEKLNVNKGKSVSVQSSSAASDTPVTINSLKRKASSSGMEENSKRIRYEDIVDSTSAFVHRRNENLAPSSQLPCLLSPLVIRSDAKSRPREPSTANIYKDAATGSSELSNSLLSEYDPVKILSRFRLQSSVKNSNDSETKTASPSKVHTSVMKSPLALDASSSKSSWILNRSNQSSKGTSVGPTFYKSIRRATGIKLPSATSVPKKPTESNPVKSARLPRPWALKGIPPQVSHPMFAEMDPTLPPEYTVAQELTSKVYPPTRRRGCLRSKASLSRSSKTNGFGTQVIYTDTQYGDMTITDSQIRLATVIYARKAVKRSKRFLKMQEDKVKAKLNPEASVNISINAATSSRSNTSPNKPYLAKSGATVEPDSLDSDNVERVTGMSRERNIKWKNPATIVTKIQENPLVDHAIELIRHKRDVQELIELMDEKGIVYGLTPMPKLKSPITRGTLIQNNIPLTSFHAKGILQKRLSTLLAHGGFTHVNLQPLCVLTDVLEGFYKKMTHRLKQVTEMEMHGVEQEFPDAVERTLVELGMGGVRGLQDFYKDRIVGFRKRVEDQCTNLRSQYVAKLQSKVGMTRNASGGNSSTLSSSSSSTHSSQPISPGNRSLLEMLSGLKTPTPKSVSSSWESEKNLELRSQSPKSAETLEYQLQLSDPSNSTATQTQKSASPSLKSLLNSTGSGSNQTVSSTIQRRNPLPNVQPGSVRNPLPNVHSGSARNPQQFQQLLKSGNVFRGDQTVVNMKSIGRFDGGGSNHGSDVPPSYQPNSNMVSINLNNNVDLGINSNNAPLVSASSGSLVNSASNSKAKLKEAISQKNLLRLNFEQIPSNCDSTVLLSSSSPSLSSSSASNKPTPTSSINQTTQLKL